MCSQRAEKLAKSLSKKMIKTSVVALSLLFAGLSSSDIGESIARFSPFAAAPVMFAQASSTATAFRMPAITAPQLSSGTSCKAMTTLRLGPTSASLKKVCAVDGKILVNGKNATGFAMEDVKSLRYGPLLRGENVPNIQVQRVSETAARADSVLGLGLVNVSNGIGKAVFRDLVWIGDKNYPSINSDDAWAAIALKGKDANDIGSFAISNFDFQNLFMKSGSYYQNVDGISTEAGYSGTISNGRVLNASDACLDIKGKVRVDNVYLAGCRQGIKAWTDQSHGLVELGTNRFVGIIGKGTKTKTRTITIDVLIASGDPSVPLFRAEDGVVNLRIGRLVSKTGQVLNSSSSYSGSTVTVGQRVYF
ncbi:hypothetical protein EDF59_11138 [Novosphingobium sp. ST904]|nr:hypothetical protein EDF59_11138 [Novosphingobium sp. ST904]